jgi:hypothetical protein
MTSANQTKFSHSAKDWISSGDVYLYSLLFFFVVRIGIASLKLSQHLKCCQSDNWIRVQWRIAEFTYGKPAARDFIRIIRKSNRVFVSAQPFNHLCCLHIEGKTKFVFYLMIPGK